MKQPREMASADRPLSEKDMPGDPIVQFGRWYEAAIEADIPMPHAMVLSTASAGALPSARVVLLKDYGERGFVFFTNRMSRKGKEIDLNPNVCLTFQWPGLERQVRIEGAAIRISDDEAESYFRSRPRSSQISASVSDQSEEIESREILERRAIELEQRLNGAPVPRPPQWGGYCVQPSRIEFWQGRTGRLHDRIEYSRQATGSWRLRRLQP